MDAALAHDDSAARRRRADDLVAKALRLHEDDAIEEARAAYKAALSLHPDHPCALRLLACLEAKAGRANAAGELFQRLAEDDPGNATLWLNLATQLRKFGLAEEALECLKQAELLRPDLLAIRRQRAEILSLMDDAPRARAARAAWADLLDACEASIARDGGDTESKFDRGLALLNLGRVNDAIEAFLELVRREEAIGTSEHLLRAAALARGRLDAARSGPASEVRKVLELIEAVCVFRQIAAAHDTDVPAHSMLGLVLGSAEHFDAALDCLARVTQPADQARRAHVQAGYVMLARGDFECGWPYHESRIAKRIVSPGTGDMTCPAWTGSEPVEGRTVLVWAEQGLGDALQFSRYASCLADLGARVILEVHPPLVRLLRGLRGVGEVVPLATATCDVDFHCALMSLPHLLRHYVKGVPAPSACFEPDADVVRKWAGRMQPGMNVGIAWTGNPAHSSDFRRSMPLRKLVPHLPQGINWWCVQKDVRESDRRLLAEAGIERPALGDFADTAALMMHLDAVVTVDTSVAHLAGSLGRPTLLLLHHAAEWRWQTQRSDCPWYPSMTLFRQPCPDDWSGALRAMARHMRGMVDQPAGQLSRNSRFSTFPISLRGSSSR